jgi:hypothetical protein
MATLHHRVGRHRRRTCAAQYPDEDEPPIPRATGPGNNMRAQTFFLRQRASVR